MPAAMRSSVVLPQPDGPSRQAISPGFKVKLTSSTAAVLPKRRDTFSNDNWPAKVAAAVPRVPQRRLSLCLSGDGSADLMVPGVYNRSAPEKMTSRRSRHHPVTPLALGPVQRPVGPLQKVFHCVLSRGEAGHPE